MELNANAFPQAATIALQDVQLQTALARGTGNAYQARLRAMSEVTDADALRRQARAAKLRALQNLPELLERFEANIAQRGATVLWAEDADACNRLVIDIARRHSVERVVKSKSMATEEIGLNHALESAGLSVVETDLGEYIVQLDGDTPSHIVMPIVHKTREQVRDLFAEKLGMTPSDDPEVLTAFARQKLREAFLSAEMGITGANFLIAETGTVVIVTNEGNGRMCSSLPPVHVVIAGIEKVIESVADFATLVQLLTRSATGQRLSSYVHLMSGPAAPDDLDGPSHMYVILLDNGRSRIRETDYAEALACIRCGACLNACPVYQNVGGHAYGWVYSGPIGAVITPLLNGVKNAAPLPYASSLCGACQAACPVMINIPDLLLRLRADLVEAGESSPALSAGIAAWARAMSSPRLYELGGAAARLATRALTAANGQVQRIPVPLLGNWTTNRDFPPFAAKSFRQLWRERQRGS
ncbi:MAG: LutB/LldF family L-lactate oxidation iron-sulfur protein [Anaerolineae bacterium]|nr:LutB/LldF family L-lactate oxidation iron-sulfur protein [Anaerolineae bacterium]